MVPQAEQSARDCVCVPLSMNAEYRALGGHAAAVLRLD